MMITVDTNAGEDAVHAALVADGAWEVRRQRLDVGDVFVHGLGVEAEAGATPAVGFTHGICVERKTWADLAASIVDGRLAEQKSRMVEPGVRYVYAVEEPDVAPWEGFYRGGAMRNKCLWGAVVKLQLRDGCSVVHTRSPEATAALVAYLAQQLKEGGLERKASSTVVSGMSQKRKRDNLSDPAAVLRAMLTVVPGMSATKADVVLAAFPTVAQLVAADVKAVAVLSCGARTIGPKLAGAIKGVFS